MWSSEMTGWSLASQFSLRIVLPYSVPHCTCSTVSNHHTIGTLLQVCTLLSLSLFARSSSLVAPVDLYQKLRGSDAGARDAFSSFVNECHLNDAFCFDLLNDHAIAFNNSRDERQTAILTHLLNGKCASIPSTPLCKSLAHEYPSMVHLSYLLQSLLLAAHQNKLIPPEIFVLSCASIGLLATTTRPVRELQSKLQQKLRHRGPLIECCDTFDMLNRVEFLGNGFLSELASLHGIESDFSTKDDARDAVVHHIVTGACDNEGGELCAFVGSASTVRTDQRKPVDFQIRILEGVLGTANRKIFSRILRVLDVPHSPADSIAVLRSSLRRQCAYLRNCRQTVRTQHHGPNLQEDHNAAFVSAAEAWPRRISHVEKTNMIREVRSLTSSNALRSFTCASCAERVRDAKRTDVSLTDINVELLRPPLWPHPLIAASMFPSVVKDCTTKRLLSRMISLGITTNVHQPTGRPDAIPCNTSAREGTEDHQHTGWRGASGFGASRALPLVGLAPYK